MMTKAFVLCAEDNETDVLLMQRIFEKELHDYQCVFYDNVNDCVNFLEQSSTDLPSLILIDIKLINSNGLDLLKFVKENERFRTIPAVMLSSSDRADDKTMAKELGCDEYIEKPRNYMDFKKDIPSIVNKWIDTPTT